MNIKAFYNRFKKVYIIYKKAEISLLAAQTSFFIILAFFPFVAFILTLVQFTNLDENIILQALSRFLPASTYTLTLDVIRSASANKNIFVSIGGIIAALWPFSRAVRILTVSINKVYSPGESTKPLKQFKRSILLTASFVILIFLSTITLLFGRKLGEIFFNYLGTPDFFIRTWDYIRYQFSVLVLIIVFIILYKFSPDKRPKLGQVFPGAAFSTIAWLLMSTLFSIFINRFFVFATIYGSIAGIILLIMWLFWGMHIILVGAAINSLQFRIRPMRVKNINVK